MGFCVAMPVLPKECRGCPDSRIDQTFRWTIGKINGTVKLVSQFVTWIASLFGENSFGWALKSTGSFLSFELHPRICFGRALRYSAETMGLIRPDHLHLGEGLTLVRVWSWVQALAGPFLFVMFSLALKNKLKR